MKANTRKIGSVPDAEHGRMVDAVDHTLCYYVHSFYAVNLLKQVFPIRRRMNSSCIRRRMNSSSPTYS